MPISNDQLLIWTNAPSSTKSQHTYQKVKEALSRSSVLQDKEYQIYLQGSYANATNTRVDSDIDVVVQLNSTFQHDLSQLNDVQRSLFHATYPNATYHLSNFRQDVYDALISFFGIAKVKHGNKSIKLTGDSALLNADVVPCLQYRNYRGFDLTNKNNFAEGMKFWTINENKEIINYPKIHRSNGEDKNAQHRTNERYKDIVRVFKNIRRRMIEDKGFNSKLAPSYFVECGVYNVPDGHFAGDHQDSLTYALEFLLRQCDASRLTTVSHQHFLFGTEPWQWNQSDASTFLLAAENYYLTN